MLKKMRSWIKGLMLLAWCVVLVLVGMKFTQQNPDIVILNLLVWQLPELSLGVLFAATLFTGVLLGLLAFTPGYVLLKYRLRNARKKLKLLEAPLNEPPSFSSPQPGATSLPPVKPPVSQPVTAAER